MSQRETPIVISLDLAQDRSIKREDMTEVIPDGHRVREYRTAFEEGAPRSADGTPNSKAEWSQARCAVARLARWANQRATEYATRGERVRLWVACRAALPLCFQLGVELSGWAAPITIVNAKKGEPLRRFPIERGEGTYFGPPRRSFPRSDGTAALMLSVGREIEPHQVSAYCELVHGAHRAITLLHATEPLTEHNMGAAVHELSTAIDHLPAERLTIFLSVPAQLAVAAGFFTNLKVFAPVDVPDFCDRAYRRVMQIQRPIKPRTSTLSVVALAAQPLGTRRLQLEAELGAIKLALGEGSRRPEFERVMRVDVNTLIETLRTTKPSVLHFSGHGTKGGIQLESDEYQQITISPEQLALTVRHHGRTVEVVVLNACFSQAHAAALLDHVDCVISMADTIDDDAAIAFSKQFYRNLGEGKNVPDAYAAARNVLAMQGMADQQIIDITYAEGVESIDVAP